MTLISTDNTLIINLPNTNPVSTVVKGINIRRVSNIIPLPVVSADALEDLINDLECCYHEFAFADLTDPSEFKNDKSSFLFEKSIASDTIVLELFKNDVKIDDIIDNTYGDFFASFTANPLLVGFVADWNKIATEKGFGDYQIVAQKTIIGVESTVESRCFRLLPFSFTTANGTVVIKTTQTGNIIRGQDYTDLLPEGWIQYFRIEGIFFRDNPLLEVDNYIDSNYQKRQIQDKIINNFILETKLIPSEIYKAITQDNILANQIFISDYNILNNETYRDIKVITESIEDLTRFAQNTRYKLTIKFSDRFDDVRKRNF